MTSLPTCACWQHELHARDRWRTSCKRVAASTRSSRVRRSRAREAAEVVRPSCGWIHKHRRSAADRSTAHLGGKSRVFTKVSEAVRPPEPWSGSAGTFERDRGGSRTAQSGPNGPTWKQREGCSSDPTPAAPPLHHCPPPELSPPPEPGPPLPEEKPDTRSSGSQLSRLEPPGSVRFGPFHTRLLDLQRLLMQRSQPRFGPAAPSRKALAAWTLTCSAQDSFNMTCACRAR